MGPIDGLILNCRVPPPIEQKNVTAKLQVESHAAGAVTHQQDVAIRVLFELRQNAVPSLARYFTVVFQRSVFLQRPLHLLDRFYPLAEYDRLLPTRCHLRQFGL